MSDMIMDYAKFKILWRAANQELDRQYSPIEVNISSELLMEVINSGVPDFGRKFRASGKVGMTVFSWIKYHKCLECGNKVPETITYRSAQLAMYFAKGNEIKAAMYICDPI